LYYGDPASISAASGFLRTAGFINLAFAGDQCNLAAVAATTLNASTSITTAALIATSAAIPGALQLTGAATAAQPLLDVVASSIAAGGSSIYATAEGAWLATAPSLRVTRTRGANPGLVGQYMPYTEIDIDGIAGDPAASLSAIVVHANTKAAGAALYEGLVLVGNADAAGANFAHAISAVDSPLNLLAANVTAALGAPNSSFATGNALAGENSGRIDITTGNSDTLAADINLRPGIDTVGANHGSVNILAQNAAQVPLEIQMAAAATGAALDILANGGEHRFEVLPASEYKAPQTALAPIVEDLYGGVQTANANVTTVPNVTVQLADGESATIVATLTARSATDGDTGGAVLRHVCERTGAAAAVAGSLDAGVTPYFTEDAGWAGAGPIMALVANGTTIECRVTGQGGDTINWNVHVQVTRHQTT